MKINKTLLISMFILIFTFTLLCFSVNDRFFNSVLSCSGHVSIYHSDNDKQSIHGSIHLIIDKNNIAYMSIDGNTQGHYEYVFQRYITFKVEPSKIKSGYSYKANNYTYEKSSADNSKDEEFFRLLNGFKYSENGLLLRAQYLDSDRILISSLKSPLFVCVVTARNS